MKSIDQLSQEHRAILRTLQILQSISDRWIRRGDGALNDARLVIEFFKLFVDRCHHGKEEKVLFPKLMEAGMATTGLRLMLYEHEDGRRLIRNMEQALANNKPDDFALYVNRYSRLLIEHIDKEDNILFAKAADFLLPLEEQEILKRFDDIENEMGAGTHDRLHRMLNELEGRYLSQPEKAA